MRLKTRTWFLLSMLCLLIAAILGWLGNKYAAKQKSQASEKLRAPERPALSRTGTNRAQATPFVRFEQQSGVAGAPAAAAPSTNPPFAYRLSNTAQTLDQLMRSDQAILLRNALIDSSIPIELSIPGHLRAGADPGSYIAQSRGPLTDAFREQLRQFGASIVAYVPNNAYLIRASAETAKQLAALPDTQTVLPWDPYYKLAPKLLEWAAQNKPLPENTRLNVLLFPGEREAASQTLAGMGFEVLAEDRSPFGWQLTVQSPADALTALAQLPGVQAIEPHYRRAPVNDLSRQRVRVSTNTITTANHLDLTGANVMVNVNDTGVDATHPDLTILRIFANPAAAAIDLDGHGTHVAGIIASSGANGPRGQDVPGSVTNANFRGMAPGANIFVQPIDLVSGPLLPDSVLQERAASTNVLISNNSWTYRGANDYTFAAANWDAAVRDAIPGQTGSQPLLFVFAAGNSGNGNPDGSGGDPNSMDAPATAKNVITVGALEQLRRITNEVVINGQTNAAFLEATDSNNQVAEYSSRGNVGLGIEGLFGRFKPDVVASGSFVVSTRSRDFIGNVAVDLEVSYVTDQTIPRGQTNTYFFFVQPNGYQARIRLLPNASSPVPFPTNSIYVRKDQAPPPSDFAGRTNFLIFPVTEGFWYFEVGNNVGQDVTLDIQVVVINTNPPGPIQMALDDLNQALGTDLYRYESGTSQAAPAVSGVLALMQEYFEQRLGRTNSPALMKALLINGARSIAQYNLAFNAPRNHQGWGLVNLTNSLAAAMAGNAEANWPVRVFDQDSTNALTTGGSQTRSVTLSTNTSALRFTLVWTDPPGNPAVGSKLVNDLDLIVTNLANGQVFIGNNFQGDISAPSLTNQVLITDIVNNVENVVLNTPTPGTYSVTVRARRVNVNSVTAHPDGIAQDYALVISGGNPTSAAAFTVADPASNFDPTPRLLSLTNGVPLFNLRAGANPPLLPSTNGMTNQWVFFVYTNTGSTNTNVAFFIFLPPNLSRPRTGVEADLDMFVTTNPGITNLDLTALQGASRSVGRSGTEAVVFTNQPPGLTYYAGVKSEDQQAGIFGIVAFGRATPFSEEDEEGNVTVNAINVPLDIPDGSAEDPQAALVFGYCLQQIPIENVIVTNVLTHENGGDLFGHLAHDGNFAVLNNHRTFSNTVLYVYDDSDSGEILISTPVDGPGTLRNFAGQEGFGTWMLTMVDNALTQTGRVESLLIHLQRRQEELTNGTGIVATILPNRWKFTFIDVPADATNLTVCVSPVAGSATGPVFLYLRRGGFPDQTTFDAFAIIDPAIGPAGGCLSLTRFGSPPLSTGQYFIGVFNPNATPVTVNIKVTVDRDLRAGETFRFRSGGPAFSLDDAVTNSVIRVNSRRELVSVDVGIRMTHPRMSDLVFHLVSPQGTRLLLMENRGGPFAADAGSGTLTTNVIPQTSSGGAAEHINVIPAGTNVGTLEITYQFFTVPDYMHVYYDGVLIFDSGLINGAGSFSVDFGPGTSTNVTIVMNEGNSSLTGTAWTYTGSIVSGRYNYLTFTENTNYTQIPIKYATQFTNDGGGVFAQALVYSNNFQAAVGPEWSPASTSVTPLGARMFLGEFGNQTVTLSLGNLRNHVMATVALDLFIIRTWDGNNTMNMYGPDIWDMRQTGSATPLLRTTFCVHSPPQAYPDMFPGGNNPARTGAAENSTLGYPEGYDSVYRIIKSFPHTGNSLQVDFSGSGLQSLSDEAWGLDNIDVLLDPACGPRGCNYYLPEEPMRPLRGESAFGDWRLEIWDTRVSAALTNSELISWQLEFTFVNTNPPAITLTNGQCFAGTAEGGNITYFRIPVPLSARIATNSLTAGNGPLLLFNRRQALPTGNIPPDDYTPVDVPAGTTVDQVIDTASVPPLQPGQTYYLGVVNQNPTETNAFTLCVHFDSGSTNFVSVIPLTNGVQYCTSIAPQTNRLHYYQFDVPSNAISVAFALSNLTGNADLVVRHGLPLPNPTSFDYNSVNPNLMDEFIAVIDYSFVFLPGRWYIGVYNIDTNQVSYCVTATTQGGNQPTDLANGVEFCTTIPPGRVQYYKFIVSPDACNVDFETYGASGNVDMCLQTGPPVPITFPTNWSPCSLNPGTSPELISLNLTNSTPLLIPGDWFIAITNLETVAVDYCIRVTETNYCGPTIVCLTNGVPYTPPSSAVAGQVDYYCFNVSTGAIEADFEAFNLSANVDLHVIDSVPWMTPALRSSANGGTANEFIAVITNVPPVPLRPGTWYLAVTNVSGGPADYTVLATEIFPPPVITVTNGNWFTNIIQSASPVAFAAESSTAINVTNYSFFVSSGAVQATFELIPLMGGNVDFYLRRGAGPVTPANYQYASTNAGMAVDYVVVTTNSMPVPLTVGTWSWTIFNREANQVQYATRATQILDSEIIQLTNGLTFTNGVGEVINPREVDYYVFDVSSNAVQTTFEVFDANGRVDLFLKRGLPLPNATNAFFASTNAGTAIEIIVVSTNSTPALTPGFWFLAVTKPDGTNVQYSVRATELRISALRFLTNCMPVTNRIAGNAIDYFGFTVSSNALEALFELAVRAGPSLEMYVRPGPLLPSTNDYFYALTNITFRGEIAVFENEDTNALVPGTWYVAVVNPTLSTVDYALGASEFFLGSNPIPLASGVAFTNTIGRRFSGCDDDYYRVTIPVSTTWAVFEVRELTNTGLGWMLHAGLPLPSPLNFDYASPSLGGVSQSPFVLTTGLGPFGHWYLGVRNNSVSNVTYHVRVTEFTSPPPILVTNGGTHAGTIGGDQVDYYRFQVSAGAIEAHVEILPNPSGNVDLFVAQAPQLPTPTDFFYASTNPGTSSELITIHTNSTPVRLSAGDWLVAVVNRDASAVNYNLRFTEFVPNGADGRLIRLINTVPYFRTNTPMSLALDYYLYQISGNARRAQFEIFEASEDVTLIARRGLPLPDLSTFDYRSANSGTNDELIVVLSNSSPVPLSAGDWYLGVAYASTSAARYTIKATEFPVSGTNIIITRILPTGNFLCLTWTNTLPGVNYFVQGKTDLEASMWSAASPSLRAQTTSLMHCIEVPTPYRFFRIVDGLPAAGPAPLRINSAGFGEKGFELRWSNSPNRLFGVEWKPALADPWNGFTNVVTSTNENYLFIDDGSETGGLGPMRFYRLIQAP